MAIDLEHWGTAVFSNERLVRSALKELIERQWSVVLLAVRENHDLVRALAGKDAEIYVARRFTVGPRRSRDQLTEWPRPWSLAGALGAQALICPAADPYWSEHGVLTVCLADESTRLGDAESVPAGVRGWRQDCWERTRALADLVVVTDTVGVDGPEVNGLDPQRLMVVKPDDSDGRGFVNALEALLVGSHPSRGAEVPTLSVVMPSYQQGTFIGPAIASVLDQSDYFDEFVVCDGGSTDGTVSLLEAAAASLSFVSEPDDGQAAAVNKAVGKTTGDVVAWLNSDDLYLAGALRAARTVFAHHPDVEMAYFAADHVDSEGRWLDAYGTRPWRRDDLVDKCLISQPACFFRRRLFDAVGGLNESLEYTLDYDLWLRMSRVTAPLYVPILAAATRIHDQAKTVRATQLVLDEILSMQTATEGRPSNVWLQAWLDAELARRGLEADTSPGRRASLAILVRIHLRLRLIPNRHWRNRLSEVAKSLTPCLYRAPVGRDQHNAVEADSSRLSRIEERLDAIENLIATQTGVARQAVTDEIQNILLRRHQADEALVNRLVREILELRHEVEQLRSPSAPAVE